MLDVRPVLIDFLQVVSHISSLQNLSQSPSGLMGLDFSHCSALKTDFSGRNSRRRFAQAVFKGHLHISCTEEYTAHIALTLTHTRMCASPSYSQPILQTHNLHNSLNYSVLEWFNMISQKGYLSTHLDKQCICQQERYKCSANMHFR